MPTVRPTARTVWDAVYGRIGADLRAVIRYQPMDWDSVMRDDVRERYTHSDTQAIVDQTIVCQLSHGRQERAFESGSLNALVQVFEDAWVVSCPDSPGRKSGVLVSIERDGNAATMADVQWCIDILEEDTDQLVA
ncbi:hypothetical protein [Natrialba swarupiae]|uniref:Uncharacterized protein n=1 Tax=Natrialba swarupiae TaxID=2448032 RepID=A0A5D5AHV7_9EURY|nr:hypothetical protein [Natrialba swarupiae]TYT60513.1 hypothetical protein FYC77_18475 [Natrialba swarupiae]